MIGKLSISRFKSIRDLAIECRKVNVFIGAPDTGKTNILDALQFVSRLGWGLPLDHSLRLSPLLGLEALFYRQFFDQPIVISGDEGTLFRVTLRPHNSNSWAIDAQSPGRHYQGTVSFGGVVGCEALDWIRSYSYAGTDRWTYSGSGHRGTQLVSVPHGANLTYIARHNARVFEFLKETVSSLDWKLRFDNNAKIFQLSEVRDDEILDYNLELISDSLKRFFFYGAILHTSTEATLVFDEPDVFAFPPYPKLLGDMIATDASNQFFLSTHNPYLLSALAEKTPRDQLQIFICDRGSDSATRATPLNDLQISRVIERGASVFFDLEALLES